MRTQRLLCSAVIAVTLLGCGKRSNTAGPDEILGPGDWTVNGISLGDSFEQVNTIHGEPTKRLTRKSQPAPSYRYVTNHLSDKSLSIKFDKDMKVREVHGNQLERDGILMVKKDDSESDIISKLGTGYIMRYDTPTGGMITTGHKPSSSTHFFFDGKGARISIFCCAKGGTNVGGFRLQRESSEKFSRYH